jgi:hypothetical protein
MHGAATGRVGTGAPARPAERSSAIAFAYKSVELRSTRTGEGARSTW